MKLNAKSSRRIAIMAASAPPLSAGGIASAHFNLFKALKSAGYSVKLFTFFDNDVPASPPGTSIQRFGGAQWLINLIYSLVRTVFEVISGNRNAYETAVIIRSMIGAFRATAAIERFAPDVVVLSDHGAPGLFIKRKPGRKIVLISHHNPMRFVQPPLLDSASKMDARVAIFLENRVLENVDVVICPSHYMLRWFRFTYEFKGKVYVLPNIIDTNQNDQIKAVDKKKLCLQKNAPIIYMPSAGNKIKGGDFLARILTELSVEQKIGFYIPGYVESQYRTDMSELSKNIDIYAPGQLSYKQHIAIVKACTFAISPAVMENFSMAIFEAVYNGVPAVAFQAGGNEDIIKNGENGFLAPNFDVDAMIIAARKLLRLKSIAEFKRNTKHYTRRKFNSKLLLSNYLKLFELI